MIYRVSFYRKTEMVNGRAPRYMVDIEAGSLESAREAVATSETIIRSVYKAPNAPIRSTPSFVFENEEARNEWYSSHKVEPKERKCHDCNNEPVERYQRIGKLCREKREAEANKLCLECNKNPPSSSRRRFCDKCSALRKEAQDKAHRAKRTRQNTINRVRKNITWATEKLAATDVLSCRLASRFQGLRRPHVLGFGCRSCFQKFIDVQKTHLSNLLAEEQTQVIPQEKEHAHGHAAGM